MMGDESLEDVEEFADKVLQVFYLGNDDGGFGAPIYGLSDLKTEREEQLRKIYALVNQYFGC